MGKIKIISLDIDGTVYPVKGKPLDIDKVQILHKLLRKVISDTEAVPIFCTGKAYQYVEKAAEVYGLVDVPHTKPMSHICEAGALIFTYNNWEDRQIIRLAEKFGKRYITDRLKHVRETVFEKLKGTTEEIGRIDSLSFNPPKGMSAGEFYKQIVEILEEDLDYKTLKVENSHVLTESVKSMIEKLRANESEESIKKHLLERLGPENFYDLFISHSSTAVDISPFPTGKALGLAYIATKIHNTELSNIIAVGDTPGDHAAFEISGIPIAVGNSREETKAFVKRLGGFVTKRDSIDAVCDIIRHFLENQTVEDFKKNWNI